MEEYILYGLKDSIRDKQKELDMLLSNDKMDREEALDLSVELDKLIFNYYCLTKNN